MLQTKIVKTIFLFLGAGSFGFCVLQQVKAAEPIPEPFEGSSFPNKDFSLKGGPVIGTQNNAKSSSLDDALGEGFKTTGLHINGWTSFGFNASNAKTSNQPMGYTIFPNEVNLTEAILRVEKRVDTVQKDHTDWGFRVDGLFGIDYYMFLSKGLFSDQLIGQVNGNKYGYDLPNIFVDVYFPQVAEGLNFRIGRSLTDPSVYFGRNLLFTHSVFDNNIGDTETGVVGTLKLNNSWTLQAGLTNTPDVAIFEKGDSKPTFYGAVEYNTPAQNDSVYLEIFALNDGNYAYHNWQTFYAIWTHKFDYNFYSRFQAAYYYENNVPVSTTYSLSGLGYIPMGALSDPNATVGRATGYSLIDTIGYAPSDKYYLGLRFEFSSDPQGTVSGYAANYVTLTAGGGYYLTKWLSATAEVRGDYSALNPAYDGGTLKNLYLFAASVTAHL
jgi:hypothetical protein